MEFHNWKSNQVDVNFNDERVFLSNFVSVWRASWTLKWNVMFGEAMENRSNLVLGKPVDGQKFDENDFQFN